MTDTTGTWEESIEWARVVAGCIAYRDGTFLLVQEKQERAYGLWNLPAGHVDKGETLEAAAIREAREETGYEVELVAKIGIYQHEAQASVKHAYEVRITGGELVAQAEEILDVQWLTLQQIQELNRQGKIRSPWIMQALRDFCTKHDLQYD